MFCWWYLSISVSKYWICQMCCMAAISLPYPPVWKQLFWILVYLGRLPIHGHHESCTIVAWFAPFQFGCFWQSRDAWPKQLLRRLWRFFCRGRCSTSWNWNVSGKWTVDAQDFRHNFICSVLFHNHFKMQTGWSLDCKCCFNLRISQTYHSTANCNFSVFGSPLHTN